ncbi:MAG TPA: site-specific integrase [Methyloceanibacter sp.]|nr:site-specific integrase [Methyloceanibacter sp.]
MKHGKRENTFSLKIRRPTGGNETWRSCKTEDEILANQIADCVRDIMRSGDPQSARYLDRVLDFEIDLLQMYHEIKAQEEEHRKITSAALESEGKRGGGRGESQFAIAVLAEAANKKLESQTIAEHVADYLDFVERKGTKKQRRDYSGQVRRLFGTEERTPDWLTTERLHTIFNEDQDNGGRLSHVGGPARRDYKAGLSNWAQWMRPRGFPHLPRTVAELDVVFTEAELRRVNNPRWYRPTDAERLIKFFRRDQHFMDIVLWATVALMYGSAMELQAVARLQKKHRRRELRSFYADGGKSDAHAQKHRKRWVMIPDDNLFEIVDQYMESLPTEDSYFIPRVGVNGGRHIKPANRLRPALFPLRSRMLEACVETGIDDEHAAILGETDEGGAHYAFHRFRHGFAVRWIQAGVLVGRTPQPFDEDWLRDQLGHSETSNLHRLTYGRYIREESQLRKAEKYMAGLSGQAVPFTPSLPLSLDLST